MSKRWMALLSALVLIVTVSAAHAGGRARVSAVQAPHEVAAGRVFELAFTVRPEVFVRNRAIEPRVTAVCGDQRLTFAAVPLKASGRYTATLTLPRAGNWQIRVDSRYCETVMEPVAIKATGSKTS